MNTTHQNRLFQNGEQYGFRVTIASRESQKSWYGLTDPRCYVDSVHGVFITPPGGNSAKYWKENLLEVNTWVLAEVVNTKADRFGHITYDAELRGVVKDGKLERVVADTIEQKIVLEKGKTYTAVVVAEPRPTGSVGFCYKDPVAEIGGITAYVRAPEGALSTFWADKPIHTGDPIPIRVEEIEQSQAHKRQIVQARLQIRPLTEEKQRTIDAIAASQLLFGRGMVDTAINR